MIPRYKAVITTIKRLSPTVIELAIARPDGNTFPEFLPGQYATLSFPMQHRIRGARSFSIVSAPTDLSDWRFGIRMHGSYTRAMSRLQAGDPVFVTGPFGQFTFDPVRDRSAVFIAGGIGVTPFLSMIKTATDLKLDNDLTLVYSVRSMDDAPYMQELDSWQQKNSRLTVVYAVSDGAVPDSLDRRVPGRITADVLSKAVPGGIGSRSVFLCGPPPFMKAMTGHLVGLGLPKGLIRTERFGVGSQEFIERGTPIPKLVFVGWGVAAAVLFGVIFRSEQKKRADTAALPVDASQTVPATTGQMPDNQQTPTVSVPPPETAQPLPVQQTRPRTMMS
ncbi:MAG: FAD-dependent oxidoreductase [Patescibacteria group bacterium]